MAASELYEVSCDAYDPKAAQAFTNLVVDSYFDYRAKSETERTKRVIQLLDAESLRRGHKLDELRERFRALGERAAKAGSVSDASMASSVESSLAGAGGAVASSLQDRITLAQVEQQVLQARLDAMQSNADDVQVIDAEVDAELASDSRIKLADDRIAELRADMQQASSIAAGGTESEL